MIRQSLFAAIIVCSILLLAIVVSGAFLSGRGNWIQGAVVIAAIGLSICSWLMARGSKFTFKNILVGYLIALSFAYLVIGYFSGSWSANSVNRDWLLAIFLGTGIPWFLGYIAGSKLSKQGKNLDLS